MPSTASRHIWYRKCQHANAQPRDSCLSVVDFGIFAVNFDAFRQLQTIPSPGTCARVNCWGLPFLETLFRRSTGSLLCCAVGAEAW